MQNGHPAGPRPCISLPHGDVRALLADAELKQALRALPAALVELRLDRLVADRPRIRLSRALRQLTDHFGAKRCVVTYRGHSGGSAVAELSQRELRIAAYQEALSIGVAWLDVDAGLWCSAPELRASRTALAGLGGTRVLASEHRFDTACEPATLAEGTERCLLHGADAVKWALPALPLRAALAAWAWASRLPPDVELVFVLMGEAGLFSRLRWPTRHPPPLTYWRLRGQPPTAPGQPAWQLALGQYRAALCAAKVPLYGVLGSPVAESWSPVLHNRCLQLWQRTGLYVPLAAPTEADARALLSLGPRLLGLRALSVTHPYKALAASVAIQPSRGAGRWQAANTLVLARPEARRRARPRAARTRRAPAPAWRAANTDVLGLVRCFRALAPSGFGARPVLLLGAGGVAVASAAALLQAGAKVVVAARRLVAARQLARSVGGEACRLGDIGPFLPHLAGIVQCTPVGMLPLSNESLLDPQDLRRLPPTAFVLDTIYRPTTTRLVADARAMGLRAMGGLPLFLAQAAVQCALMYRRRPALSFLQAALEAGLKEGGGPGLRGA